MKFLWYSANYLFCRYQKAKVRHDARRMFKERFSGGLFQVVLMSFLESSCVIRHNFSRKQIFFCKTHQKFARKPENEENWSVFFTLSENKAQFVNYMNNFWKVSPEQVQGSQKRNTLLVGCFRSINRVSLEFCMHFFISTITTLFYISKNLFFDKYERIIFRPVSRNKEDVKKHLESLYFVWTSSPIKLTYLFFFYISHSHKPLDPCLFVYLFFFRRNSKNIISAGLTSWKTQYSKRWER